MHIAAKDSAGTTDMDENELTLDDELSLIEERLKRKRVQEGMQNTQLEPGKALLLGLVSGVAGGMSGRPGNEIYNNVMQGRQAQHDKQLRAQALEDAAEIKALSQLAQIRARGREKSEDRAARSTDLLKRMELGHQYQMNMLRAQGATRAQQAAADQAFRKTMAEYMNSARSAEAEKQRTFQAEQNDKKSGKSADPSLWEMAQKGLRPIRDAQGAIVGYEPDPKLQKPAAPKAAPKPAKPVDPYDALPQDKKIAVKKLSEKSAGKANAIAEFQEALKQLESAEMSEDAKVMIGQMLLKKLNDPEMSDAVGAEEVQRLGAYLQLFNMERPGSTFGRDLPRFTQQVKSKMQQMIGSKKSIDSQIDQMLGRSAPTPSNDDIKQRAIEELRRRGVLK